MNKFLKIIFADAVTTAERIVCIFSALFWAWITFVFLQFFFSFILGIYFSLYGMYPESIALILQSRKFTTPLIYIISIFIFLTRIPLYKRRVITESKIKLPIKKNIKERYNEEINKVEEVIRTETKKRIEPQVRVETYKPEEEDNGERESITKTERKCNY